MDHRSVRVSREYIGGGRRRGVESMPDPRAPSAPALLVARARARAGLAGSAAATVAVAVATVSLVFSSLEHAASSWDEPPPGVSADELSALVATGQTALAAAAPALIVLVVLFGCTAIAQLGRLLRAAREHETDTMRARGMSWRQGAVTDAVESLGVAAAGGVAGFALAAAVSPLLGLAPLGAVGRGIAAVVTTCAMAAALWVSLRVGRGRRTTARGGRATAAVLVGLLVLASVVVVWQLPAARASRFDPIVAVAPAVVLLGGALVALAVFNVVAVAAAAPAAAAPAMQPSLSVRQIARRIPLYAVAVLLIVLTTAQAVFTSAYAATWTTMASDSAAVRAGTDLRVDTAPQAVSPTDVAEVAAVPGVDAASAAVAEEIEIGATAAQLVAVPGPRIAEIISPAGGLVDRDVLTAAPAEGAVTAEAVELAADATGIRVTAVLRTDATIIPEVDLAAVLLDATGAPAVLRLSDDVVAETDGTARRIAQAPLPEGTAPWRLLAVTAGLAASAVTRAADVSLTQVEAVGSGAIDASGELALGVDASDGVLWLADGADAQNPPPPLGVVISDPLASRLGLGVGDPFEFRYAGSGRRGAAVVSDTVPVVPGTSSDLAVFAPLETLLVSQLQRGSSIVAPRSVFASGAVSAAPDVSRTMGDRPVLTSSPGVSADLVGALVPGWWIATIGAAVLAIVAASAIVHTLVRARRPEFGVIRALGVTPARQARMLAGELAGVFGASLLLGLAAGALVAWLVVPALVRAVTPGILPIAGGVTADGAPLAAVVLSIAGGLSITVLGAASRVRREARVATVGEDAR